MANENEILPSVTIHPGTSSLVSRSWFFDAQLPRALEKTIYHRVEWWMALMNAMFHNQEPFFSAFLMPNSHRLYFEMNK